MEILFLALAATVSFASLVLWSKARHAVPADGPRALLPAGDRTPLTTQIGDIVELLDRDWLVEGAIVLSESPRAARLCRLIDGAEERFLYAATQPADSAWLLHVLEPAPDGRAEELLHEGERLRLESRWRATVLGAGKMGRRIFEAELRVYEYAGAGGRLILALDGATRSTVFVGERILPHAIEILPGRG